MIAAFDRTQSEDITRLIRSVDPILDIIAEDGRLIGRVSRPNVGPGEFQVGMAHPILNDVIDEALDPAQQRSEPFLKSGFLRSLGGGTVDLWCKSRRRQGECVADNSRQPLVEIVFVRRFLESLVFGAAGTPDEPGAGSGIPGQYRIEPFLKLADLVRAPVVRCIQQTRGNIALGKVLQLHGLPAKPDIDCGDDLLYRAEPIRLVRARVPRHVQQLLTRQKTPWSAVNNLLVRRSRRLWAPPGTVEQQLDGSAVDDVEPHDIATTGAADLECRRLKY